MLCILIMNIQERAALIIQQRRRLEAKVKIINILKMIERQRRSVGLIPQGIIANYDIISYEGSLITRELAKLSIQDFVKSYSGPFWWALVRNGIYSYSTYRNDHGVQIQYYRQLNGDILLAIIRKFCRNIEAFISHGVIHPMDIGGQLIKRNCPAFMSSDPRYMQYPNTWRAALELWDDSFGRLGELPPRASTPPPKRAR